MAAHSVEAGVRAPGIRAWLVGTEPGAEREGEAEAMRAEFNASGFCVDTRRPHSLLAMMEHAVEHLPAAHRRVVPSAVRV